MTLRDNLDAPEATLDALMQSVVCPNVSCSLVRTCEESLISQEVRWRNGSLRIVMVLTDAGFKTALDGKVGSGYLHAHIANTLTHFLLKVAALLTRNDGECHLRRDPDMGFYEYSRTPEQVRVCQNPFHHTLWWHVLR